MAQLGVSRRVPCPILKAMPFNTHVRGDNYHPQVIDQR